MQSDNAPAHDSSRETAEYLERIRRTIADSRAMVAQMELRFAETDRLLASQGLTREQVAAFRFTPEQRLAVNAELARRGLPTFDDLHAESDDGGDSAASAAPAGAATADAPDAAMPPAEDFSGDLEHRRQKFGLMMKPFQI